MKHRESRSTRLPLLFWLGLIVGLVGLIDDFVFLAWRWDKPVTNPGGPLQSMGSKVIAWEVSGHTLVAIGSICMIAAIPAISRMNHLRQ